MIGSQKLHIAILGGGIRGTSLAALLSATGCFGVSIIERSHIGAGASSTNHGRFHLGTWNYRNNTDITVARNWLSYQLLYQLPNATSSTSWSYYCIESEQDVSQFVDFCEKHYIPFRLTDPSQISSNWIRSEKYAVIVEIPEFSFNPANLAARFTKFGIDTGNCSLLLGKAKVITQQSGKFWIHLHNNMIVCADVVINMLGRWSNEVQSDLDLPKLELLWNRWRLLALQMPRLSLPPLERAITIEGNDHKPLGALPHGSWAIFGCDVPAESLDSPEDLPVKDTWRFYDPRHSIDYLLLKKHAQHFPVLEESSALSQELYSFSGVYPELKSECTKNDSNDQRTPYGTYKVYENFDIPNYFVVFGGNATTAILDATEMVSKFLDRYIETGYNSSSILETLSSSFPKKTSSGGMIWESLGNIMSEHTVA